MKTYRIVLLEGDGIGPVLAGFWREALPVLAGRHGFAVDCRVLPFGKTAFKSCGEAAPRATLDVIPEADAALLAAVDVKDLPGSPVGRLRRELDLYADIRPIRTRAGRRLFPIDIDMVFVRETTQGFLPDRNMHEGNAEWMPDADTALSMRLITRASSERIARRAFEYAAAHGRKKVTALHKASIFKKTCGLFLAACRDVAARFPAVVYEEMVVDDAANRIIADPAAFDVVLTTNLFGDILSDEASALAGSLVASANLGERAAVFLPASHGPCYHALTEDSYDVLPAALCAAMLLDFLGEHGAAAAVERAADLCLRSGESAASVRLHCLRQALENGA